MLTVQMTVRKIEVVLMDRCGALGLAIVIYLEKDELIILWFLLFQTHLSIAMAAMVDTEAMIDIWVMKLVTLQK